MKLQRWLYRGGRPRRLARLLDGWTAALYGRGIAPDRLVTLEMPGRRSGRTVELPLVMARLGGERYLVSMLGPDANWVRNVRASAGAAVLRHGRRERVRLEEVAVRERAPVLREYVRCAPNARTHIGVQMGAPLHRFVAVSAAHPVFRVTSAA